MGIRRSEQLRLFVPRLRCPGVRMAKVAKSVGTEPVALLYVTLAAGMKLSPTLP